MPRKLLTKHALPERCTEPGAFVESWVSFGSVDTSGMQKLHQHRPQTAAHHVSTKFMRNKQFIGRPIPEKRNERKVGRQAPEP